MTSSPKKRGSNSGATSENSICPDESYSCIYEKIDKLISEFILQSVPNISIEDLVKMIWSFSSAKYNYITMTFQDISSSKESWPLIIELLHACFLTYSKERVNNRSDKESMYLNYTFFSLRFIILVQLELYESKLIETQANILISGPSIPSYGQLSLIFFFITFSSNESNKDSVANLLFSIFDYKCLGFIESNSKPYLSNLRTLISYYLYYSDSILNHFLINKCQDLLFNNLLSKLDIKLEEQDISSLALYKKVLFFMGDPLLKREFTNYVSHNFVFQGANSNNKVNLKTFKDNLAATSYSLLNASEIRKSLMRFVFTSKRKEIEYFMDEFSNLVTLYNDLTDNDQTSLACSPRKQLKLFDIHLASSMKMQSKLEKYEFLIGTKDNFTFYKQTKEYQKKFLLNAKSQNTPKLIKRRKSIAVSCYQTDNFSSIKLLDLNISHSDSQNEIDFESKLDDHKTRKKVVKIATNNIQVCDSNLGCNSLSHDKNCRKAIFFYSSPTITEFSRLSEV